MQQAREVAVEMLTEFIIEHPTLLSRPTLQRLVPAEGENGSQPVTADGESDDETWREVDPYGEDSYENQFKAQLQVQLRKNRALIRIERYLENPGGFIEFEILFPVRRMMNFITYHSWL
jgi:hypothetical protein